MSTVGIDNSNAQDAKSRTRDFASGVYKLGKLGSGVMKGVGTALTSDLTQLPVIKHVDKVPGLKRAKSWRDAAMTTGKALAAATLMHPAAPYVGTTAVTLGALGGIHQYVGHVPERDSNQEFSYKNYQKFLSQKQGPDYSFTEHMRLLRWHANIFRANEVKSPVNSRLNRIDEKVKLQSHAAIERLEVLRRAYQDLSSAKSIYADNPHAISSFKITEKKIGQIIELLKGKSSSEQEAIVNQILAHHENPDLYPLPDGLLNFKVSRNGNLHQELKDLVQSPEQVFKDLWSQEFQSNNGLTALAIMTHFDLNSDLEAGKFDDRLILRYTPNIQNFLEANGNSREARKQYTDLIELALRKIDVRINSDPKFNPHDDRFAVGKTEYEYLPATDSIKFLMAARLVNTFIYKPDILKEALENVRTPIKYTLNPLSNGDMASSQDDIPEDYDFVPKALFYNRGLTKDKFSIAAPLTLNEMQTQFRDIDHENFHLVDALLDYRFSTECCDDPENPKGDQELAALRTKFQKAIKKLVDEGKIVLGAGTEYDYAYGGRDKDPNSDNAKEEFFAVLGSQFLESRHGLKKDFPDIYSWFQRKTGLDPVNEPRRIGLAYTVPFSDIFNPDDGIVVSFKKDEKPWSLVQHDQKNIEFTPLVRKKNGGRSDAHEALHSTASLKEKGKLASSVLKQAL